VGGIAAKYLKSNIVTGKYLVLLQLRPLPRGVRKWPLYLVVEIWRGNYAKIGDRLGVIVDRSGTECGCIVDAFGERRVSGGERLNGDDNDCWIKQKLQHGWTDSHGFKDKRGLEAKTKADPFA
jgi:hypothetical protein